MCVVLGWPYLFSGGLFRISLRKIFRRLTRETGRLQKKYEEALGNAEYTAEYARKALECIHQVANLLEIDCPQSMERYLVFCSVCVCSRFHPGFEALPSTPSLPDCSNHSAFSLASLRSLSARENLPNLETTSIPRFQSFVTMRAVWGCWHTRSNDFRSHCGVLAKWVCGIDDVVAFPCYLGAGWQIV